MRCLTIWQPWATLWLLSEPEEKIFETRTWATKYRGPVLVHAARRQDRVVINDFNRFASRLARHGILQLSDMPFGALIGQVDLIDCCKMSQMDDPSEDEREVGFWSPERYAWRRAGNPLRFPNPIPYTGRLGLFNVPDELIPGSQERRRRPAQPGTRASL